MIKSTKLENLDHRINQELAREIGEAIGVAVRYAMRYQTRPAELLVEIGASIDMLATPTSPEDRYACIHRLTVSCCAYWQ